jgi:hypothetical protein
MQASNNSPFLIHIWTQDFVGEVQGAEFEWHQPYTGKLLNAEDVANIILLATPPPPPTTQMQWSMQVQGRVPLFNM